VITNNFDCLCADVGLPEMSLRRYDTEAYFPLYRSASCEEIEFDPAARCLLMIGEHADRRLPQMRARQRGLRLIYIAPERYFGPDGTVIPYPVEAPQGQDLFIRMTAGDAMPRIYHALVGRNASGKAAALYRSTVFWTPSDLKLCGIRQGTSLLMSHLGRGFVAMPSNQPSLIVLTLELVQR
jgi:hypothetical protein